MATIGGDRDKLLKAFLTNGRRKRKPGRVNLTTPRKGEGEGTTYSLSGRKPPSASGYVKYPTGTIGPNDARAKALYGKNLPPAFPATARKAKARKRIAKHPLGQANTRGY